MPDQFEYPNVRTSREHFEAALIAVRNGASLTLTTLGVEQVTDGQQHDAVIADQRAVWHTAEVALALLSPGYVPKREALDDVRRLMRWLDAGDDEWLGIDQTHPGAATGRPLPRAASGVTGRRIAGKWRPRLGVRGRRARRVAGAGGWGPGRSGAPRSQDARGSRDTA